VEKAITTALLIIAGIICTIFVFNTVYPMVGRSSSAMVSMTDQIDDRMKSRINIVHEANSSNRQTVYIWVKNVGTTRIDVVDECDVFLGQEGSFNRIPYVSDAGATYPRWSYTVENDTEWKSNVTVKFTVSYDSDPGAGTYFVKVVIPNGIEDEDFFSMS
jgi:archaellum component FlaF (FlaF/FlaG flagellin family)